MRDRSGVDRGSIRNQSGDAADPEAIPIRLLPVGEDAGALRHAGAGRQLAEPPAGADVPHGGAADAERQQPLARGEDLARRVVEPAALRERGRRSEEEQGEQEGGGGGVFRHRRLTWAPATGWCDPMWIATPPTWRRGTCTRRRRRNKSELEDY